MKIAETNIALASQQAKLEKQETEENLTAWSSNNGEDIQDTLILSSGSRNRLVLTVDDLLRAAGQKFLMLSGPGNTIGLNEQQEELDLSEADKMKIKLIETFIESLTGKKIKIKVPKIIIHDTNNLKFDAALNRQTANQGEPLRGWGVIYNFHESRYEKETMSFNAQGVVRTQDGKEINIDIGLNMTREFYEQNNIQLRAGDATRIDPLVINLDSNSPSLSTTKFSFDLDADGESELIPSLAAGSGFLALDANNDGIINNGSELFGPQSGDGFSDLAQFDSDHNQWIDENDAIYNKLRIWLSDSDGNKSLLALGAVGIGAIYLGNVGSPFELKAADNQELGQIQKTGIFLFENGNAGTIQHIDLAV